MKEWPKEWSVKTRIITSCGDLHPETLPNGKELRVYRSSEDGMVVVTISDPAVSQTDNL